jgi:ribonuclease R
MKQAEYAPDDMGHYALAEEDYCHFTSPIRRYPDLTIHRLIGQLAAKKPANSQTVDELLELGKHCSITERRAEKAERELIKIKLLRYMSGRIGEEMEAFITGVESFGMFCQGIEVPAEGMVHLSALGDDFYVFDQPTRTLKGSRTKREFRLGDPIKVVVAAVDIDRRMLDLRPVLDATGLKRRSAPRSSRPSGPPSRESKERRGGSGTYPEPGRGRGASKNKPKGKAKSKDKTKKGKKGRR